MKRNYFVIILLLHSLFIYSQISSERKKTIDIFLSDEIIEKTNMRNVSFINNMCITKNRYILLSSKDSLYFVGYGGYNTYKPHAKSITTFCILDSNIYYAEQDKIFQVNSEKGESLVLKMSFAPLNLWGGEKLIYASFIERSKNILYAIYPEEKRVKQLLYLNNKIVSVVEYYSYIYIFTTKEMIIINSKNGSYITILLPQEIGKEIYSAAIDKKNGGIFISCTNGLYRFYKQEFHKLSSDKGILCYDKDGLILFNSSQHFLLRLRNNIIYPQLKKVIIEIK